jgi:hypothetical protein
MPLAIRWDKPPVGRTTSGSVGAEPERVSKLAARRGSRSVASWKRPVTIAAFPVDPGTTLAG